jgi:hypothetical protein
VSKTWVIDEDNNYYFCADVLGLNTLDGSHSYKILFKNRDGHKYFVKWFKNSNTQSELLIEDSDGNPYSYRNLIIWDESRDRYVKFFNCSFYNITEKEAAITIGWFDDTSIDDCKLIKVILRESKIDSII